MSKLQTQTVLDVHHWNENLFSFRTSRDDAFRFANGHFVMIGLEVDGKPCLRAYSIASPNWAEHLEFFSIKVADGALTSRLQHLQPGDEVKIGTKPVGTLVLGDLKPGERLFLYSSGTGLAPFMSIIRDFEPYEQFEQVILVHSVRTKSDLAYHDYITQELPEHEYLGEMISNKLRYLPVVTRESFCVQTRIPEMISTGALTDVLGIEPLNTAEDRSMICGSMAMLHDTRIALEDCGFASSPSQGEQGDFVFERAFVER
ncbi:MAG: ferredoxin--NADP reductase [Pseudomonadota bacterium]